MHIILLEFAIVSAVFYFKPPPGKFHLRQQPQKRGTHVQMPLTEIRIAIEFPFTFGPGLSQRGFHCVISRQQMTGSQPYHQTNDRHHTSPWEYLQFHSGYFFPALLISSIMLEPIELSRSPQNEPPPLLLEPERERGLLL